MQERTKYHSKIFGLKFYILCYFVGFGANSFRIDTCERNQLEVPHSTMFGAHL